VNVGNINRNEKGAALLLILFIIVFVAIVGATMINSTFYGKKNNVIALADQHEFYRLEAAIDMMLHELREFEVVDGILLNNDGVNEPYPALDENGNEIPIIKRGPYYYLAMGQPLTGSYVIDGQTVQVDLTDVIGPNAIMEGQKQYTFKLTSQFISSQKFVRELELSVTEEDKDEMRDVPPPPPGQVGPPQTPKFPGNSGDRIIFIDSKNVHHNQIAWNSITKPTNSTLQNFINYYGLDTTKAITNWNGVPVPDVEKIRYYNEINASGNAVSIAIQEGYLTYANKVNISGCGGGSVTISGVLIANEIKIGGQCTYYLGGGIISGKFELGGNAASLLVDEKGGFKDDGGAGEYTPSPPNIFPPINYDDFNWGLDPNINIINMETIRK
jgi:hypothetical protein